MTEMGERASTTQPSEIKAETGSVRVSVRSICTGQRISEAAIKIGIEEQNGDDQGEATFNELSVGEVSVKANKRFKDADYQIFLVHRIPFTKHSISRSFEAKSSGEAWVTIIKDKETRMRIEIPEFRVEDGIRFCRKDLKMFGDSGIDYGHWWIETGGRSYGWWPKEDQLGAKELEPPVEPAPLSEDAGIIDQIKHMASGASYRAHKARFSANYSKAGQYSQAFYKTFRGVPGILNGDEEGKEEEKDPYHGKWKQKKTDEDYHPVIDDCRTKDELYAAIREFALAYSGEWSWIFEAGKNCHSFQIEAMSELKLEKVKRI